jgi:hypothetical protein
MKLENTPDNKKVDEIVEYISMSIAAMKADKAWLDFHTRVAIHDADQPTKNRVEWDLVHFQGSWLDTIRNLERLQKAIKGADAS